MRLVVKRISAEEDQTTTQVSEDQRYEADSEQMP
jgi:hypothetical protein